MTDFSSTMLSTQRLCAVSSKNAHYTSVSVCRVSDCNLERVEGNAADGRNPLTHESLVVLDSTQSFTGVIHHSDELMRRPTAVTVTVHRH